jgi:hypothetical protein
MRAPAAAAAMLVMISAATVGWRDLCAAAATEQTGPVEQRSKGRCSPSDLAARDPAAYRPNVASTLNNLGNLYSEEREVQMQGPRSAKDQEADASAEKAADEHPTQWTPSPLELKRILARHRGWLVRPHTIQGLSIPSQPLPEHDPYLEEVEPAFPDWRSEALSKPERATLLNANLRDQILIGAILSGAQLRHGKLEAADLRGADLSYINLSHAFLWGTNLTEARLDFANLTNADLSFANLSGARMIGADLSESTLNETNLSNANLSNAYIREANLLYTNLSGAYLGGADLSKAGLFRANLTNTRLADVNLTNSIYDPASEPPYPYVANIKGLSSVQVPEDAGGVGLVQLRKLLQDAGLRDSEREATYSIERAKTFAMSGWPAVVAAVFRWLAFDLTTAYGLHPVRALFLIIGIWLLCVPVYSWSIVRRSQGGSGIYQIFPANRIAEPSGEPTIEKDPMVIRVQAAHWWTAVPMASYFSLLSAANIGFQQFTPGDWIRRVQPHEYELQAEGWVRVVAGVQALLSVFLLAIWVLTQFGRPFE